jgi:26S proteasome regulatory subunit N3
VQWLAAAFLIQDNHNKIAFHVSESLLALLHQLNMRSLDAVQARAFFFLSLSAERLGSLPSIRERLMLTYRTCVLLHDISGQATLLNLLLRNYLKNNLCAARPSLLQWSSLSQWKLVTFEQVRASRCALVQGHVP